MTAPYTVTWGDRTGEIGSARYNTFAEALEVYRARNAMRGLRAFICGDGAEHDGERWHDDLTEEESEQL